MTPKTVYKSAHPDVLAAWDGTTERQKEWAATVKEFASRWPNHQPLQRRYPDVIYIVGLKGEGSPGPGWRFKNEEGRWVPDKRTSAGKTLAKEIDALVLRGVGKLLGMPSEVLGPGHMYSHGVDVWDRTIWASWSCGPDLLADVDLDIWEPGKLSEYYAALEQHNDGSIAPLPAPPLS